MPVVPDGSPLAFPCDFPIKVMGRKEPGFAQAVTDIVRKHAPDFDPSTVEMRPSRQGTLPQRHLRGARHLARAARRPLPGAVRPSHAW